MITCPNCGTITKDGIKIYNKSLRKQHFSMSPILPVCRHCGAEVTITNICKGGNIIVLNGTSGSGKSTIAEMFMNKGFLAIDGDCAIQVIKYKNKSNQWDFTALADEIACEIDILSMNGDNFILATVILPEDMEKYIAIFNSRNMKYTFFLLKPEYQTAVERCHTRTCHTNITQEYWIKHFYDLLHFDSRVVVIDNTHMKPEETALYIFARSELQRMNIVCDTLSLIRDKDGVSVWRVFNDSGSVVMKCFDKPEYRREIMNYQLLKSLAVPTLQMVSQTDCSLVIEDIAHSQYRLGTMEDINDPHIARKIAIWYKTLHQNGRDYANTHDFIDEYDTLTRENIRRIQNKTGTKDLKVWWVIAEHFDEIHSAVMNLPRTLVYTDFHFSNLAVAQDGTSALVFDYNFFFKSYAYSDIRNVCGNFYNEEAKKAFLSAYGSFDEREIIVDDVASVLSALHIACSREAFPIWAKALLESVIDGQLLAAVEKLMEDMA